MLRFPIPSTFIYEGSQSYGLVPTAAGLRVSEDLSVDYVVGELDMNEPSQPVAVRKKSSSIDQTTTCTVALPGTLLPSMLRNLSELEELVCIQRFCRSARPGSKPSVMRVHVSVDCKPFGCMLSNKCFPQLPEDPSETDWTRAFCVSSETSGPDMILTYKLVGKSIASAVETAGQVKHFIENFFSVRVNNLVIDLIGSQVIQIKSFTLRDVLVRPVDFDHSESRNLRMCYVCKRGKEDLSKFVTHRMISECVENMRTRNVSPGISFVNMKKPSSEWTSFKCCDICYSLILNERELWKIARQIFRQIPFLLPSSSNPEIIACAGFVRIFVACEALADSPASLPILSRVEISLFRNHPLVSFPISDNETVSGSALVELGLLAKTNEVRWLPWTVSVLDAAGAPVASGVVSAEYVGKLFSSSSTRLVTLPVYLGQSRWSISLVLGFQADQDTRITAKGILVIPDTVWMLSEPVLWRPLPDEWISTLRKKRSWRRRRSRSVGKN